LESVQRARLLPLARWLVALAIPDVGEETAHDLAKFHPGISAIADSFLLRSVLELNRLRAEIAAAKRRAREDKEKSESEQQQRAENRAALISQANALGRRLIEMGFAQPAKKKDATDADVVLTIGPVAAQAVMDWFESETGQKILSRLKTLGIAPEGGTFIPITNSHLFSYKTFVITGSLVEMGRSQAADKIRALGGNVSSAVSKKTDYLLVGENPGSKLEEAIKQGVKQLSETEFLTLLQEPTSKMMKNN